MLGFLARLNTYLRDNSHAHPKDGIIRSDPDGSPATLGAHTTDPDLTNQDEWPKAMIPTVYAVCLNNRPSATHKLKTPPVYFDAVAFGKKTFEIRRSDQDFRVGDKLYLCEWNKRTGFTGRSCTARVNYMLSGGAHGIEAGFVVMAIEPELREV